MRNKILQSYVLTHFRMGMIKAETEVEREENDTVEWVKVHVLYSPWTSLIVH